MVSEAQIMAQPVWLVERGDHATVRDTSAEGGGRRLTLDQLAVGSQTHVLDADGVRAIAQAVFLAYAHRKIVAVRVEIPQRTIANLAAAGSGVLVIRVIEGQVEQVRTLRRDGDDEPAPADGAWYAHVVAHSPIDDGQMVDMDAVDRYVRWLNRHPGRRVDIALSREAADAPLSLDYIITEARPFGIYAQTSNTGTESTGEWRQRFGLFHHNLTGADDSLTIDYVTASFEDVHAISGSYSRPLWHDARLRGRVFGSWNTYTASEIGLVGLELDGEGYAFGGELNANVFQHKDWFVDLIGGIRYEHAESFNPAIGTPGETGFVIPYATAALSHRDRTSSTSASLTAETNLPNVAGTEGDDLTRLGRSQADRAWWLLRYAARHSFYLEPIFDGDWGEPDSGSTMANELSLGVHGQVVLGGDRVPASFTGLIGGFYTVRGYPQAFTAADNTLIATAEYRLHIPRLLAPGEPMRVFDRPFRHRPERELGRPDWDMIGRAFIDVGRATFNDRLPFERNVDLLGAGVGVEISLLHHLRVRTDFAWALRDANNGSEQVTKGSQQIHIEITVAY